MILCECGHSFEVDDAKPLTHRLLCGDSTDKGDVERVMGGNKADIVFTDPPYNCSDEMSESFYAGCYSPAMRELSVTKWDQGFDMSAFLSVLSKFRPDNGTVYVCTSHFLAPLIWQWSRDEKSKHSSYICWCKPNPMPSLSKRHPTWGTELICYTTFGKHCFNFPKEGHALNWWEITATAKADGHPTQKPVDVPARAIGYSSELGGVVLDPFLGSGTTLVACENLGRRGFGIEIDPGYCAVILERITQLDCECSRSS